MNPTKVLPGALVENEERGWLLELDGHFDAPGSTSTLQPGGSSTLTWTSPEKFAILVGTTNQGKLISLVNCMVLGSSLPFGGSRGNLRLWPESIIYGVHFESIDDFRLTSLSVRYSNLDAWVATSGFDVKVGYEPYSVQIRYVQPASIESRVSDALSASIDFAVSGPSLSASSMISVVQQSWLTIKSNPGLPFNEILLRMNWLADFVSLGVGESLVPLEMSGSCNAQDQSGATVSAQMELIYNRKPLASNRDDIASWEMLFTLNDIRPRFGDFIAAWFARDAALQSLYILHFGTIRSPSMHVEHRFLNLFQAIESYDRRTVLPSSEELRRRSDRIERILTLVDGSDKQWLKRRLKQSNGPSAMDRIKRVVANLKADWLLTPEDIALAADLRNYHTHFDPSLEQRLPPMDVRYRIMHNLAVRLRVLCELVLLTATGFSADDLRNRMERSRRVQRHLVDQSSSP